MQTLCRRFNPFLLVIMVSMMFTCCSDDDDDDNNDTSLSPFDELVAWSEKELTQYNVPGGAIAIIENGSLSQAAGIGVKKHGTTDTVDSQTLFRIGSVTKMLSAATIMTLVEEGVIDTDDPVTAYVPDLDMLDPHNPADMTVHHCLTHTSGLPDYGELICDPSQGYLSQWFSENLPDFPFWTPPGRLWNYSNLGYSLVGLIAEEAAGVYYAQALSDRVLDPAGMTNTTFEPHEVENYGNYAYGHDYVGGGYTMYNPSSYDCSLTRPAGFLYSNVEELAKFAEIILASGGDVLSAQSISTMTSQFADTHMTPIQKYGYGFFSDTYKGLTVIEHGGAVNGFLAEWLIVPETGFGVIVLLNGNTYPPMSIAHKALDLYYDLEEIEEPDWTTDPSTWGMYTQTYYDPYVFGEFPVEQREDQTLWVKFYDTQTSDYLEFQLIQYAADNFYMIIPEINLAIGATFYLDDTGQAEYFVTRLGVGKRIDQQAKEYPKPHFSQDTWNQLVEQFSANLEIYPSRTVASPLASH